MSRELALLNAHVGDHVAKHVLLTLAQRCIGDGKNECYPSLSRLQQDTELSRRSLIRKLNWLETHGWIKKRPDPKHGASTYVLNTKKLAGLVLEPQQDRMGEVSGRHPVSGRHQVSAGHEVSGRHGGGVRLTPGGCQADTLNTKGNTERNTELLSEVAALPPDERNDSAKIAQPPRKAALNGKPRERNLLFDALAAIEGGSDKVTPSMGSQIGKALKEIKTATPDVTTEEIQRRSEHYRQHFKDVRLTVMALAKHWGRCAHPPEDPKAHLYQPPPAPASKPPTDTPWLNRMHLIKPKPDNESVRREPSKNPGEVSPHDSPKLLFGRFAWPPNEDLGDPTLPATQLPTGPEPNGHSR